MNTQPFLELSIPNYQSVIHLLKIIGTESLFAPFQFELTLLPESVDDFTQLKLASSISFAIHHNNQQTPQWFNGVIETIQYPDKSLKNSQHAKLRIMPKLSLMQFTQQSRSFVNLTAKDILKQLCREHQILDVDFSQLAGTYPELPYCVQYQETDLQFLQRLCSNQGIYYYFQHSQTKHVLVFSDHPLPGLTYSELLIHRNTHSGDTAYLYHWTRSQKSYIPIMQSQSFTLLTPTQPNQAVNQSTQAQPKIPVGNFKFLQQDDGGYLNNAAELAARLKNQHAAQLLQQQKIACEGNYPYLSAGMQLNIASEIDAQINGAYYINQIQHTAIAAMDESEKTYQNILSLYPQSLSFVPSCLENTCVIPGIIPAVVTGPSNADAYTQRFAEVKVQPKWNTDPKEASSWVRVKQMIAGNGFGSQWIPRINQNVLLSYQQGQAHKPSVIGGIVIASGSEAISRNEASVLLSYNAKSENGFQTRTLGADATQGHRLKLDDTPNQELFYLKSQRDKDVLVKGNHQCTIQHDSRKQIQQGIYAVNVQDVYTITAKQKLHFHVGTSEIILDANGVHFHADTIALNGC